MTDPTPTTPAPGVAPAVVSIAPTTWEGMLGVLLMLYRDGPPAARSQALAELQRMARAADYAVELQAERVARHA